MNRIERSFKQSKAEKRGHLTIYLTAGHPSLRSTELLVSALAQAGVDMVELGIPFSDPLADGPVIQAAGQWALEHGCTVRGIMDSVKCIRQQTDIPLIFMTCWNPILQNGPQRFAEEAKTAGIDGVLVTDLPPEEASDWVEILVNYDLRSVFLVAPSSTPDRIAKATELTTGFVYCVSRPGVTGARDELPGELAELVNRIRGQSDKPVSVGFGISTAQHVREVCQIADGAIVGSAMVRLIEQTKSSEQGLASAIAFARELAAGKTLTE
ncbi:MAG: tryptophan synthase subunit alpha [Candidatus Zipacnadales bacterium]